MADEGRAPIVIRLEADYDHWVSLRRQPAEYKAEKARILAETIQALEGAFPGLGSRVEASDVSTPTTCERYTANWRGSTQGWIMTAEQMRKFMLGLRLPKRLRGIRGLRLAGQWTEPGGGIPPSAKSGKEAALAIAREEGRRMVSRD
jgi:phytoene dehydrogenase-like protein